MYSRAAILNSDLYTWEYFQNDDVCRLCWSRDALEEIKLKSSENAESTKNLLAEKIEDCLNLDLSCEGAPEKVCLKCCDIIESFYDFKRFCYEADRKLKEILINHVLEIPDDLPEHSVDIDLEKEDGYSDTSSESRFQDYINLTQSKVEKLKICINKSEAICSPKTKDNFSSVDSSSDVEDSFEEYLNLAQCRRQQNEKVNNDIKEEHCTLEVNYSYADTSDSNLQDDLQEYLNLAPIKQDQIQKTRKQINNKNSTYNRKHLEKETSDSNIDSSSHNTDRKTPLRKKINQYRKQSPTFCYICRTDFKTVGKFIAHNSEYHGIEKNGQYKCFGCDKRFKSSKNRLGHEINFCKGLKEGYKCAICGRCLPKRRSYEKHMNAHRLNKPANLPGELFKCGKCYKSFVTKENLTEHKKSHETRQDFVCEECGRCFTRRDYLNKHRLTHQGLRQHACPHCDYRAVQKTSLLIHLRKHTGERPFSCDLCPQRCVTSSNLRAHRRRHLGVKHFQCTICPKKFGYKQSLEEHTASTHERATQLSTCPHCGAIYSRKCGLRRHIKAKHGKNKGKPLSKTDGASGEE